MDCPTDEEIVTDNKHACHICKKTFATTSTMRRHISQIHKQDISNLSVRRRMKCPLCTNFTCRHCTELNNHLELNHDIRIEIEHKLFADVNEFESWKSDMERKTCSSYRKQKGKGTLQDGSRTETYNCSRSGHYNTKGSGARALKRQGSKKINSTCPAKISVVFKSDKTLNVTFVKTHCGHSLDELHHLSLDKSVKMEIAAKLQMGISKEEIINEARQKITGSLQRNNLITRQDINNVIRDFKVDKCRLGNSNDGVRVQIAVDGIVNLSGFNENNRDDLLRETEEQFQELYALCDTAELAQELQNGLKDMKSKLLNLKKMDRTKNENNLVLMQIPKQNVLSNQSSTSRRYKSTKKNRKNDDDMLQNLTSVEQKQIMYALVLS